MYTPREGGKTMRCVINGIDVYMFKTDIYCPVGGERCVLSPRGPVDDYTVCMFGDRDDGDDEIHIDCKLRALVDYAVIKLDDGGEVRS